MNTEVKKKIDKFFTKYQNLKFKKGQILIHAESVPTGVFYLKEGVVKQYAISANGEELVLNIFKPASFFPMPYIINNSIPKHYFEAMNLVLVGRVPKEDFLNFLRNNNDVLIDLLSRIYYGLEGFLQRMEYLMTGSASNRLITELLIYAKRFGEKQENGTVVKLKLTEKDLAAQSGITRETVSREIQKLREKNLISFQKNILTINDLQELEKELNS